MPSIYLILIVVLIVILFVKASHKDKWKAATKPFPPSWRIILAQKVSFYNSLNEQEKNRFENKIQAFLLNCRITGIDTEIDTTDKLLVAGSAVIPIFAFDDWKYTNLYEVLIYPGMFNEKFETAGKGRRILGMVGSGYMEGKMILSKKALHDGFQNETDKKNTAIHEFVHLVDKIDGKIDGIPTALLKKQYAIPWLDLINQKIAQIYANSSDINPYGATNRQEFFAVTSEYFFERPKLLKKNHPKLYDLLEEIFEQKMTTRNLKKSKLKLGRNSPCPCGNGLKFKKCCGKLHYH